MLPIARYAVPPVWQIAVTIALPLVSAALFKAARSSAPTESAQNITPARRPSRSRMEALAAQPRRALPAGREGRRSLLVLIAAAALLLATVRSFSSIGLWGSEAVAAAKGSRQRSSSPLVSTAFLALFALATLVKTTGWRLDLRVSASVHHRHRRSVSRGVPKRRPWDTRRSAGRPYAAGRLVCARAVLDRRGHRHRCAYHALVPSDGRCSSRLRAQLRAVGRLAGQRVAFSSMIMLGAAYPHDPPPFSANGSGAKAPGVDGEGESAAGNPEPTTAHPFKRRSHGRARITRHRGSMRRHRSREQACARETEIFILLAQGRTRTLIQEELVLAENTVKTHIAPSTRNSASAIVRR